jgi:ankyrin repeat protein
MMALHWNHADIAEFLLDAGAVPTDEGPIWGSALRIAVHEGGRAIVSRLLRAGANVDVASTWSGRTALHEAVMYRNYEAIEALISAGANVKARDKDGKTPIELAPIDPCVIHLFRGRLIKDEPTICQPIKRETATFGKAPQQQDSARSRP